MSDNKPSKKKFRYFILFVLFVYAAVNAYNKVTHNSNAGLNSTTQSINGAISFFFGTFLLFIGMVLVSLIIFGVYIVTTTRKRMCIPKPVYRIYNQRKSHGYELIALGKNENFDKDTPVPGSIECVKFAFLFFDTYLDEPQIKIRPILVRNNFFRNYNPGTNKAICIGGKINEEHTSPHEDCTCGFYALKSYDELLSSTNTARTTIPLPSLVLLNCSLQGKIIEASNGYRAELLILESLKICSYCLVCSRSRSKSISFAQGVGIMNEQKDKGIIISLNNHLVPLCDKHLRECDIIFSLQQLREALQLDVDWYEINPLEN